MTKNPISYDEMLQKLALYANAHRGFGIKQIYTEENDFVIVTVGSVDDDTIELRIPRVADGNTPVDLEMEEFALREYTYSILRIAYELNNKGVIKWTDESELKNTIMLMADYFYLFEGNSQDVDHELRKYAETELIERYSGGEIVGRWHPTQKR